MLRRDPKLIVKGVVESGWERSNTPLSSIPNFHTGWYNFGSTDPQVTFTNAEESTVNGGDTGITAGTGAGGIANVRAGTLLVNCWGGTRSDMEGAGPGGTDVNPKAAAYQMAREVNRILGANAGGTRHPQTGEQELLSLVGDPARDIVDTDPDSTVYRYEVTARYTYAEEHD